MESVSFFLIHGRQKIHNMGQGVRSEILTLLWILYRFMIIFPLKTLIFLNIIVMMYLLGKNIRFDCNLEKIK